MTTAVDIRVDLGLFPTPLHPVPDSPGLIVKRDDLSGFGLAGNKTRPLEYLIADAREAGSRCVVSGGMSTSTFIGALAEAACRHGMQCHLIVPEPLAATASMSLARLLHATVEPVSIAREALDADIARRAEELTSQGHAAYAIPRGGATPVGAMGFLRAVTELTEQYGAGRPATIVLPVGSGASIAGLIAGAALMHAPLRIVGVSVSRPIDEIGPMVKDLARAAIVRAGGDPADIIGVEFDLVDRRAGLPPEATRDGLRDLACRGILVDAHYGLPTWILAEELARETVEADRRIIVWHTGGMAAVPSLLGEIQEG